MTDLELLKQYGEGRSEQAFAELVGRHLEWVYGAAARRVHNRELAEDVAQGVFIALARRARAKSLGREQALTPWLLRVTRCAAISALRAVSRRQRHEQKAAAMRPESITSADSEAQWEEVAPLLDDQVLRLGKKDQEAILLRFYERKSLAEVGVAMGLSEEAAKKRVQRAVGKLREKLEKKGITGTTAGLSAVLVGNVVEKMPEHLVKGIVKAICGGGTSATADAIAKGAMKMMSMARIRVLVTVLGVVIAGVAVLTPLFAQQAPSVSAPTTKPAMRALAAPYVAKLPNGLTLEVVGLSYYPSVGRPWWRPDGSPLPNRPYQAMDGIILSGAGQDGREIAVRITNQPANPATVNWITDPGPGASGRGRLVSPTPPDVQALAVYWGGPRSTASIVFRIAAGPWIEAAAGQPQMCVSNRFAGSFVFSDACEVDGQTRISVADDRPAEDHRFVALDDQNREHSPSKSSGGGAGPISMTNLQFADLRSDELKQVKVQLRPFDTTVRFDGVALNPDQKTEVKVDIQGPAASEAKGHDQFP